MSDQLRAWLRGQPPSHVQFERCLPETETISASAPLSLWREVSPYQTLRDCESSRSFDTTDALGGRFFAEHQKEIAEYKDWLVRQSEAEANIKDKQLEAEVKQERSKLPKEVRDLAAEYDAGNFDVDNAAQKQAAHEQVEKAFDKVLLRHREKFPALAAIIASDNLEEQQARAQRCIASDDPRLKGK